MKTAEQGSHPRITFEPSGLTSEAAPEANLLDLAVESGLPIRSDCGGRGVCGKCRIKAGPAESLSAPTEAEEKILNPQDLAAGSRLACQTEVLGEATIEVPPFGAVAGEGEESVKTELAGVFPVNPVIERIILPAPEASQKPKIEDGDLLCWLETRTAGVGRDLTLTKPEALRGLAQPEALAGELTLVNHSQFGVGAVLPGRREGSLGLAVDVGTTTIAVYLCDLKSGQVITSAGAANPQRRYGEDVISRIAMIDGRPSGLATLQRLAVKTIDELLDRCLEAAGRGRDEVDELCVVGNTTMEQITAGLHPHGLGMAPYLPVRRRVGDFRAMDLGLSLAAATNIHFFPVVSGFVGGDTMGAILAVRPHEAEEICLIVDIGTNGELVLGDKNGLWVTSCATGPALEGAHISCGMRAVAGAIHRVGIDPESGELVYQVMGPSGATRPVGLCGSGVIDALAALRRTGIVLESGRFVEGRPGVIVDEGRIGRGFVLVGAEESAAGQAVVISLNDVRQVQLAKAALRVGIEFLMEAAGVKRVDRLVLTGAFGARFDWRSAVDIGMLPAAAVGGAVEVLANGAGLGAIAALLDRTRRDEAGELIEGIKSLELANLPEFNQAFPLATSFPPLKADQAGEG